jgi:hypothetical protein
LKSAVPAHRCRCCWCMCDGNNECCCCGCCCWKAPPNAAMRLPRALAARASGATRKASWLQEKMGRRNRDTMVVGSCGDGWSVGAGV